MGTRMNLDEAAWSTLMSVLFIGGMFSSWLVYVAVQRARRRAEQAHREQGERELRRRGGVWAGATVVILRRPIELAQAHSRALGELRLLVHPPSGQDYPALVSWLVELHALDQVQPGQELSIKIDPLDPQVIYPNVSWAREAISAPA